MELIIPTKMAEEETKEQLKRRVLDIIHNDTDETQVALAKTLVTIDDLERYYESLPIDTDCRCTVCRGSIRSTTTISKSEAIHLIELAYLCKKERKKWIMYSDITNSTNEHWGTKSTKGTQLQLWGLIELSSKIKKINAPEVDGVPQGSQRLTDYGYDFIQNRIQVNETVYKDQFGNPIGWSNNKISIYDVQGKGQQLNKHMVELHYKNRGI